MRKPFQLASAGVLAATCGAIVWPVSVDRGRTAVVTRGTFTETLVTRGTVTAARMNLYGSTIAGLQAKILEIVPEGRAVNAGDVLVRFDAAPFQAAVEREAAAVAQAEAELVRAEADLRLEQMRGETDLAAARAQIGFAEAAFANERDGRGPLAVAEADAAASEAARQADRAAAAVDDLKSLLANGFATRAELDRAQQNLQEALDRRRVAALKLQALKTFEQPAALEKSRAEVSTARKTLTGTLDAAQARIAQRRAIAALAGSRLEDARRRLAAARDHLERTIVRAETGGLVVYRELFFGTEKRKPQPGDEVWPNQPLVAIPDPNQLLVETRVRETDLQGVDARARVTVAVDAFPSVSLNGQVAFVGALAQEDAARAGSRFFPVTIKLLSSDPRLRTGMSARVDLEVARRADALMVPLDALVDEGGVLQCRVVRGGQLEDRAVQLVARNETVAAVTGLAEGETVLLVDPAAPKPAR
jgi:HlyD family secretion protein